MKDPSSTPHVKIASLTLPPDVQGEVRGELVVCVELAWNYRKPPQQVGHESCSRKGNTWREAHMLFMQASELVQALLS
jgi:hypothetical protein